MTAVARLRSQIMTMENQMGDEIAKAWRLAPTTNMAVFAATLGMTEQDVRLLLEARGIFQRTSTSQESTPA